MRFLVFLLVLGSTAFAQVPLQAVGKFPSTRVQVQIGVQERAKGTDFYRKAMHIQPRFTFEGASSMLPIPAAEAQMIIITYDTRAKFVENKDLFKVLTSETIPVPAIPNGARRQLSFAPSDVTFDGYRDNSNVGGDAYKYYVFALRDAQTKALIDFETNCLSLANQCKTDLAKREEILKMAVGAKFPSTFK
jgi:hypothetical protein